MPNLNPGQLRKWGDQIELVFDIDASLLDIVSNPDPIPGEFDCDWRVFYPDADEPSGWRVVAEWVNTWPLPDWL